MKQYKLINRETKEETICTKIELNGIDYYVNDDNILINDYYISFETNYATEPKERFVLYNLCSVTNGLNPKKVIATNNPSVDTPKIVDEDKDFSKEDVISFAVFYYTHQGKSIEFLGKDLFELWKEQKITTIYYTTL